MLSIFRKHGKKNKVNKEDKKTAVNKEDKKITVNKKVTANKEEQKITEKKEDQKITEKKEDEKMNENKEDKKITKNKEDEKMNENEEDEKITKNKEDEKMNENKEVEKINENKEGLKSTVDEEFQKLAVNKVSKRIYVNKKEQKNTEDVNLDFDDIINVDKKTNEIKISNMAITITHDDGVSNKRIRKRYSEMRKFDNSSAISRSEGIDTFEVSDINIENMCSSEVSTERLSSSEDSSKDANNRKLKPTVIKWLLISSKANLETIQKVLSKSPKLINYRDPIWGMTALHWAVNKKKEELVKYLCEEGADLTIKNGVGETPIHLAKKLNYSSVYKYFCRNYDKSTDLYNYDYESAFYESNPKIKFSVSLIKPTSSIYSTKSQIRSTISVFQSKPTKRKSVLMRRKTVKSQDNILSDTLPAAEKSSIRYTISSAQSFRFGLKNDKSLNSKYKKNKNTESSLQSVHTTQNSSSFGNLKYSQDI